MTFTPNPDGIEKLFAEIAAKLERIDSELRAEWTGKPADDIEPVVTERFAEAGVHVTGSLRNYAESIERNEPFQLNLD